MTTPTLRQLDIFAQLVAAGSVTECARELGVPATTIITDIAALEQRLGHRLFDMRGGQARLTEAGHTTVAAMQRLSETQLDQWAQADAATDVDVEAERDEAVPAPPVPDVGHAEPAPELTPEPQRDFAPEPRAPGASAANALASPVPAPNPAPMRQQIVIAAHPAIFSHFQDALDAFEQANPDIAITLDLDTHVAAQAGPLLARGAIDIAYYYTLGEDGLDARYAWSEPLALYIGEDHPLAAAELVSVEDLAIVPPLALQPGNGLRALIDRALDRAGVIVAPPEKETDNLYDIMTAVRDGEGWFAAFGPLARDCSRMSGVKRMPLDFALPPVDVRQAVRTGADTEPVVATLAEYLFR